MSNISRKEQKKQLSISRKALTRVSSKGNESHRLKPRPLFRPKSAASDIHTLIEEDSSLNTRSKNTRARSRRDSDQTMKEIKEPLNFSKRKGKTLKPTSRRLSVVPFDDDEHESRSSRVDRNRAEQRISVKTMATGPSFYKAAKRSSVKTMKDCDTFDFNTLERPNRREIERKGFMANKKEVEGKLKSKLVHRYKHREVHKELSTIIKIEEDL